MYQYYYFIEKIPFYSDHSHGAIDLLYGQPVITAGTEVEMKK